MGSLATFRGSSPYPPGTLSPHPLTHTDPTAVGAYTANAFGLYDMHGNVEELCLDGTYDPVIPPLPGGTITNRPPAMAPIYPFVRGGGYDDTGDRSRSAYRGMVNSPGNFGFRVVLAPTNP